MEVIFNELAVSEMNDAIAYYELQFSGLGIAFKEEIKKAINRIIKYPKAWSTVDEDIRKYVLHKFTYNVYYSLEKDHLYIIAIAHQHRKPNYWIDRMEE
jgi:plasmid stabilization system protein ParE